MVRLTREAGLLAPTAKVRKRAARLHAGTITVTVPDTLWATDATDGFSEEGRSAVFVMIAHASGEAWADAGLRMDRFAAADLLREVSAERFGSVEAAVASGLALRYDGGPCFRSKHYQAEIDHLGIARSPAFHYEPETNGCAEKFIQTLKEAGAVDRAVRDLRGAPGPRARVRSRLQRALVAQAPRLPHADRSTSTPCRARSGSGGMIVLFTQVSGEPGPGQPTTTQEDRQPTGPAAHLTTGSYLEHVALRCAGAPRRRPDNNL